VRVAILPTGRLEWEALPQALQSLFPNHEFYSLPTKEEVCSNTEDYPAHSFTSCDVVGLLGRETPNAADKLIERAAAEAIGDARGRREVADLVVIIDDLEIANLHQPESVVAVVRESAQRYLNSMSYETKRQARYVDALKSRVSFHLAKPMIESWLFADLEGLKQACNPSRIAQLMPDIDPECFHTNDPEYDADDGQNCQLWHSLSEQEKKKKKKTHKPEWLKTGDQRKLHPKAYLSWLCFVSDGKKCSSYSETGCGAEALKCLSWDKLFINPNHACFARSMIYDIAATLNEKYPFPNDENGKQACETVLKDVRDRVLRNL